MNAEHPPVGDDLVGVVGYEPRCTATDGVRDVGELAALSEGRTVELVRHPGSIVGVRETR